MTHTSQSLKQQLGLVIALAVLMLVAQPMATDVSADPASAAKFTWTVNGSANASVQIGNVLYVGGSFSRVSPSALLGSFYGLSAITGQLASLLPVVDGEVAVIEPDGAGGYYIGGSFTRVGGFPRTALARIGSDGTIDPGFVPALENIPNAPLPSTAGVTSIARDGGRLFIAGHFTSVGGASRSGLAAIDASSGAVTPWVAGRVGKKATVASGRLVVIAALGNSVVATGLDLTSGAIIWDRILGSDSNSPGSAFFSRINDVIAAGSRVVVGGRFGGNTTGSGPTPCVGTLAWLDAATGAVDTTWVPSSLDCGEVKVLSASGGTAYVGGAFTRLGGLARVNAAAVDLATGAVTDWTPEPNGPVTAIGNSSGGSVYLGGQFTTISGHPRAGLGEIDASQTLSAWTANAYSQSLHDIVVSEDGSIVVASSPAISGGIVRHNLAAFDLSTGAVLNWQPHTDAPVSLMASAGNGTVFVGGPFESVNGAARTNLAAIDATSGSVLSWNANFPFPLNLDALLVHNDHVYVAGSAPLSLRRFHGVTGALDATWTPALDFFPETMIAHEGRLYVGGNPDFQSTSALAAVDLENGQRLLWTPAVTGGEISTLTRADTTLFVGGSFTSLAGQPRAYLGAFDLRTGLLLPWAPGPDAPVRASAVADRVVVASGSFTRFAGQAREAVAAATFMGTATLWSPGVEAPSAIVVGPTDLALVGIARAQPAFLSDISTFALSGAPRPSNLKATVAEPMVSLTWTAPVGVQPIGYRIEAGSRPGSSNLGTFGVDGLTTSVSTVAPSGIYFVRVRALLSAGEPATAPTNEVVLTVGCTAPPPPPTGLFVQMSGAHVTLHWTPPSAGVSHAVEFGTALGAKNLAVIPIAAGQQVFDADAPPGRYFARVRALNACGSSGPSGEIMFTVGANVPLPEAPTGLTAVVNGATLTLSWTAPSSPVIGYVIEAGSASGLADLATIPLGDATSLEVPGVPLGTYFVRVRAVTGAGVSPPSADIVVVR